MPDMDGIVVITNLNDIEPSIQTMLLTGHGDDKLREATQALNAQYFEKEEMNKFWSFIRRNLQRLEKHMAAAGMATGGDIEDALDIESGHERKR
jgi:DNA-binding NtrC family response regulator